MAEIEFTCPECKKLIRTKSKFIGKTGPCPHCNMQVTVQASDDMDIADFSDEPLSRSQFQVSALIAGLIGFVATLVLYGAFLTILKNTLLGELFTKRGPIPFFSLLLATWGWALLALKYFAVKKQLSFLDQELELLPVKTGVQITPSNVGSFLHRLSEAPRDARESIIGARIRGALEHFRARGSVPEVQAYLASHGETDASRVEGGYTLLRVFIWAVPILGFIGTVMGISESVQELSTSLAPTASANEDPSQEAGEAMSTGQAMTQAMQKVTQGLSVAFDTTFIALTMAIFLLFPTETLRRIEYSMLERIETFTNESVLRRMHEGDNDSPLMPAIEKMLEPAFREHQKWLMEWEQKVSGLGRIIGKDFEQHAYSIQQSIESAQANELKKTEELVKACSNTVDQLSGILRAFEQFGGGLATDLDNTLDKVKGLGQELQSAARQFADAASTLDKSHQSDAKSDEFEQCVVTFKATVEQFQSAVERGAGNSTTNSNEKSGGLFGTLFGKRNS